jgi:hypothetical protein
MPILELGDSDQIFVRGYVVRRYSQRKHTWFEWFLRGCWYAP